LALGAAAGLALVAPGAAQAATKSVLIGPPPDASKTLQQKYGSDVHAYFPSAITIHVGDSVKFVPVGFQTVHFLGRSGKAYPVVVPTGKTISGVLDEAGVPFGFNGLPELNSPPQIFGPGGKLGKTVVTDGTKEIESGAPITRRPKPMTVKFTKAGVFTYVDDIHPGTKGAVRVVAKSKPVPSAAADALRVKLQVAKAIGVAKGFENHKAAANTVDVGVSGSGGVNLFGFVPEKLTVPVGTTVTFQAANGNSEIHTASTGPGNPDKEPKSYLGKVAASFEGDTPDPKAVFPSDPGAAVVGLSPTLHGNGFWSSGVTDGVGSTPLPASGKVTFAAAGTYEFYCLIHTFMHATVTAQ